MKDGMRRIQGKVRTYLEINNFSHVSRMVSIVCIGDKYRTSLCCVLSTHYMLTFVFFKIMSPLPQCLSSLNLVGWWFTIRDFHRLSHMTIWSYGLEKSPEKLNMLYLHYHSACNHQTWQGGDLPEVAPTDKVVWPIDHVILWDHVSN